MDKKILEKWLAAGYIEQKKFYPTISGVPQGGLISASLLNVTLSGLEQAIKSATRPKDKVHISIYADDFIITGATEEVLENTVKPIVESFLSERGLILSKEKTKITHINKGFDFLGMNIRKYDSKLIIKPAKSGVKRFLTDIRSIIKKNRAAKTENLIHQLNPKIRGWANYYRHVCSKKTFSYVDHCIFQALWWWAKRRHPNKSITWIKHRYFRTSILKTWEFFTEVKGKDGKSTELDLVKMGNTSIKRHVKVQAEATPFDPAYSEYFNKRISERQSEKKSKRSAVDRLVDLA